MRQDRARPVIGEVSRSHEQLPEAPAHRRVLIVESDQALLGFESEALSSFRPGFAVATARTPDHAAEWLDTFAPDLIIIGLNGGGPGALDAVSALLSDPRTRSCKIVVLSDDGHAGSLRPWMGARAHAVLERSAGLPELLRTVRDLV